MDIRGATQEDSVAIRETAERSWEAAYGDILDGRVIDETVEDWYSEEFVADALSRSDTVFLVAVEDGDVVGFAHGVSEGNEGDVLRLYVDPDQWGNGIGRHLFERMREQLAEIGVSRLKAMVLAENEIGNSFYRSLGFERESKARTTIDGSEYDENTYVMVM